MKREREIFEQFVALVNTHCKEQRQLSFYADRLCLTERYLGTAIRQASGTTAKEWIDRATVMTAKVMLRHTRLSVSQISDSLHFANDSFFCKFFKRVASMTPGEYRNGGV